MMSFSQRRGSVLIMALWIVAILSVMVISFAFEARQQVGIDVYVRERNRVNRVVDSGRMIGEAILLDYKNAKDPENRNGVLDWKELFEEDRWCIPKWELKATGKCIVGPISLEEEGIDYEEGEEPVKISVELDFLTADLGEGGVDINSFNDQDDKNWIIRFQTILLRSGITEDLEVEVEDADRSGTSRHNLMNLLMASWKDWRDDDTVVSRGPLTDSEYNPKDDDGAEVDWYKQRYEEDEIPEEEWRLPPGKDSKDTTHAGGPIKKIDELTYIRGFRDFPSVYYGGYLYDGTKLEKEMEKVRGTAENPHLTGLKKWFKVGGGPKMIIVDDSPAMAQNLSTIPELFPDDPEDQDAQDDCDELIQAIIGALKEPPEDDDDAVAIRGVYPYKDFQDLCTRVEDFGCDVKIPQGVSEYLEFPGSSTANTSTSKKSAKQNGSSDSGLEKFSMTITGESMGMKYVIKAWCVISDNKIQYTLWNENEVAK